MWSKKPWYRTRLAAVCRTCVYGLVLAGFLGAAVGRADDFYKGKLFTIVVGFSPGGGYDTYARVLSRYMATHIPGNPNVIVQNMPGAGSLTSRMPLSASAANGRRKFRRAPSISAPWRQTRSKNNCCGCSMAATR